MTAIFSVTPNDSIGANGKLLQKHFADFAHFKIITQHAVLLAGKTTAHEMPLHLNNRSLLVLSKSKIANRHCVTSIEEALQIASGKPLFVIGGANVLSQTIDKCHQCIVTRWENDVLGTMTTQFNLYRDTHHLVWSWKTKYGFSLERWVRNGNKKGEMESKECGSMG